MLITDSIEELRASLTLWRKAGQRIALVPTMGNLHAGHLRLVKNAHAHAERVVVSIFVNPTQFGPGEDFSSYPRTLAADQAQLEQNATDLLFIPNVESVYTAEPCTRIIVDGLSDLLCGAFRPGHFSGVATIVAKLFNIVQPELAFFGEKDFQQLTIIRKMVSDLNFPIQIHSVATERELDGLAMSSRNSYLTPAERQIAPLLYQILCDAKQKILDGHSDYRALEMHSLEQLNNNGFQPDYFAISRRQDLTPASIQDTELVILAAAKLGKPRLIDNLSFSLSGNTDLSA